MSSSDDAELFHENHSYHYTFAVSKTLLALRKYTVRSTVDIVVERRCTVASGSAQWVVAVAMKPSLPVLPDVEYVNLISKQLGLLRQTMYKRLQNRSRLSYRNAERQALRYSLPEILYTYAMIASVLAADHHIHSTPIHLYFAYRVRTRALSVASQDQFTGDAAWLQLHCNYFIAVQLPSQIPPRTAVMFLGILRLAAYLYIYMYTPVKVLKPFVRQALQIYKFCELTIL